MTLPDSLQVEGVTLRLNGMGLRTFSLLEIRVYVAGLYLQHPSHDADAILTSNEMKMMDIHFIHDASADRVRDAWREGFEQNCQAPCHLAPQDEAKFFASVPALRKGDSSTLLFTPDYVEIAVNGHKLGRVQEPTFMRVLLATFIGPHPPTERLKRGLLGTHE